MAYCTFIHSFLDLLSLSNFLFHSQYCHRLTPVLISLALLLFFSILNLLYSLFLLFIFSSPLLPFSLFFSLKFSYVFRIFIFTFISFRNFRFSSTSSFLSFILLLFLYPVSHLFFHSCALISCLFLHFFHNLFFILHLFFFFCYFIFLLSLPLYSINVYVMYLKIRRNFRFTQHCKTHGT